ncbi:MAG TPA: pteridine reductase [Leucothrix mucor]|nr:pteridine reductase [Leucothrix mucor]
MQNLKNKVALVTGSARRIGAEAIRILHADGANVVVHYRRSSVDAERLSAELNAIRADSCMLVQGDLMDIAKLPEIIEAIIHKMGRLDVLVNNASTFYPTPMGEITEENWDDLMGSNLKAPLFLSQAAAPYLKTTQGCIVNIVDVHGFRPMKSYPVYSVAKAGLLMLTQSLARELGPDIRVNGVAPGAILWPELGENQSDQDELLAKTALKREGAPQDIAKTILFLVRDADYITGQVIPVDGGRMLNH